MPDDLFLDKDHLNYRYFHKRAFYLAVLASLLLPHTDSLSVDMKFSFSLGNGDPRRPVLVLHPVATGSPTDFSRLKCCIRILPCISPGVFSSPKLGPRRNNVRPGFLHPQQDAGDAGDASTATAPLPRTPRYNSSVLHDSAMAGHLNFLHTQVTGCAAFKDAAMLGKVWLYQRTLHDTFGGFLWTMLMGYLLTSKSSAVRIDSKPLDEPEFTLDAFKAAYDVVIVDPTGQINLAWFVTSSVLAQLQHEARSSLALLKELGADRFEVLFLKKSANTLVNFDSTISIRKIPSSFPAYKDSVALDFPSRTEFACHFYPRLLTKALKSRLALLVLHQDLLKPWDLAQDVPDCDSKFSPITIGFSLEPENSLRAVELGPGPEDTTAVTEFRRMWGSLAQLRRFNDGTIAESVLWEADSNIDSRSQVTAQMAVYLLSRHGGVDARHVITWGGQLVPFLSEFGGQTDHPAAMVRRGTFQNAMDAFQGLSKAIRALNTLPLAIDHVTQCDAGLSYCSTFPPQPHVSAGGPALPISAPVLCDAMDVIVQLEGSSKWPQTLAALQQAKLAFYVRMAELLKSEGLQTNVSRPDPRDPVASGFLEVAIPPGYVFRVRIKSGHEAALARAELQRAKVAAKAKESSPADAGTFSVARAAELVERAEQVFDRLPAHVTRMHNLCLRHPHLSSTVRLLRRFVAAHLLLGTALTPKAADLLAAASFCDPAPFAAPPASSWCGLMRCLALLRDRDWAADPTVAVEADRGTEIDPEALAAARKRVEAAAAAPGAALEPRFQTAGDLDGEWWRVRGVKERVKQLAFRRLCSVAEAALKVVEDSLLKGTDALIPKTFATPLADFDVVLRLDPARLPRFHQSLSYDSTVVPTEKRRFKNLGDAGRDETTKALELFDPMERYIETLK
ncbi:hypothetical protein HK405_009447, partial [Cladochytrium tenue]